MPHSDPLLNPILRSASQTDTRQYRPPADPLVNPFSLQFPSPTQEKAYLHAFAASRSRTFDRKACLICLVVHVLFALLCGGFRHPLQGYQDPLLVAYGIAMVVQCVVVHRLRASFATASRRLLLIIVLRLSTDTIVANGMLRWIGSCSLQAWPKHLTISTGVFSLWWQAFFYVLPFKWMLLTQAISVLQYHRAMSSTCCSTLMASPGGEAAIRAAWHEVGRVCGSVSLAGRVNVLEATAMEAITAWPQLACLSTTLLLQVMLGYAVPLLMLYTPERNERLAFWAATHGQAPAELVAAMRLGPAAWAGIGLLVLLVMVCVWESALVLLYNHLLP